MSSLGNPTISAAFLTDQFSGNGSTTVFTMSVAPATTSSILVAVSGVVQDPSTYSVVGTALTFSAAPPTGTGNVSVRYLGIPASGVATTAYRTVTEFTATAGQTTFNVPSYTVGYINVYDNGVRQGAADFTATNGTTVVLATAAAAGDLITVESFYVSSVLNAIPAVAGAVNSTYIANTAITPAKLSQPLTLGTAVATTSGTSIDFTGIPSWVKRITIMFSGVSTNGVSNTQVQIGAGSITSSGYTSYSKESSIAGLIYNSGYVLQSTSAVNTLIGHMTITAVGGNLWVASSVLAFSQASNSYSVTSTGIVTLSGILDRVRLTTVNGTDTFDAGSVNILYEG